MNIDLLGYGFKGNWNSNLAMAYAYQHIKKDMRVQSTSVSQYNSFRKCIHHTAHYTMLICFLLITVNWKSHLPLSYLPIIILTTSFIFAPFPTCPKKKDFFPRTSKAGTTWSYRAYKDWTKKIKLTQDQHTQVQVV